MVNAPKYLVGQLLRADGEYLDDAGNLGTLTLGPAQPACPLYLDHDPALLVGQLVDITFSRTAGWVGVFEIAPTFEARGRRFLSVGTKGGTRTRRGTELDDGRIYGERFEDCRLDEVSVVDIGAGTLAPFRTIDVDLTRGCSGLPLDISDTHRRAVTHAAGILADRHHDRRHIVVTNLDAERNAERERHRAEERRKLDAQIEADRRAEHKRFIQRYGRPATRIRDGSVIGVR